MPLSRDNVAANIAAVQGREAEEKTGTGTGTATDTDTMGAAESSNDSGTGGSAKQFEGEQSREDEENVFVSLTYDRLDATQHMARVKSAKAGAVLLFAGCTRDSFHSQTVTHLSYSTYAPLALKTLSRIARSIKKHHNLTAIAITHRLGRVDVGDESILIAVASPHRQAAWQAGEACLEDVKKSAEIWKEEWFQDGGVWRSNRDGEAGVPVRKASSKGKERAERRESQSQSKGKGNERENERKGSDAREREERKERLPSRRKSSVAGGPSQIGIKKAATEPPRPQPVKRTTTFYEGGFEI